MKNIDLHIHTNASADGTYDPMTIVEMASLHHMELISITDHNSISSVDDAIKASEITGVTVLPGIEIDCVFEDVNLHMTGYGIDFNDERYEQLKDYYYQQAVRVTWNGTRAFLNEMNISLSDEVLKSLTVQGMIVPEDLADYLLHSSEYDELEWLKPYREGGNRSDNPNVNFYWDYFSQGKAGYIKETKLPAEEIIDLIHQTEGLAVIAHPGQNFRDQDEKLERLLRMVDGLEVYSSYHTEEDVKKYRAMALRNNKIISAGTDYHGHHKPSIELGEINEITEEDAEVLYDTMMRLIK